MAGTAVIARAIPDTICQLSDYQMCVITMK